MKWYNSLVLITRLQLQRSEIRNEMKLQTHSHERSKCCLPNRHAVAIVPDPLLQLLHSERETRAR